MPSLFPKAKPVSGWEGSSDTCARPRHHHPSGYAIEHCGHATAIRPWDIRTPGGRRLHTEAGLAWSHLATAKAAVEAILRGEATTREDERGRMIFSPPPQPTVNAGKTAGVGKS